MDPQWSEREGEEREPYFVELVVKEQRIRLYFVKGVEEEFRFETRTRKEISVSCVLALAFAFAFGRSEGERGRLIFFFWGGE